MISPIILIVFFGLWYYFTKKPSIPKGLKSLPSPRGARFLLGHIHLLGSKPHETLTNWAKELNSGIYSIKMGRLNFVMLNNDKLVGDLLQKRGKIYSSRFEDSFTTKITFRGISFGLCPYNDTYRKAKAIISKILSQQKIESYSSQISKSTKEMISEFINANSEPINPRLYIRRTTLNVMLDVIFGTRATSIDDPLFIRIDKWANDITRLLSNVNQGLDYFPILRYIPGNSMKKEAFAARDETESLLGEFLEDIKSGKNKNPCVLKEIYEQGELTDLETIQHTSNFVFGGTDTVAASVTWLIAFLANNPSFQEHAHKELDALLPDHVRLPTYNDSKNLPYIRALIREGQRVHPPSWLGLPHCLEQDDEYNGYHIPANSLVFINMHAISFDETRYKNAKEFDPYRFINTEQTMGNLANGPAEKRDHFSFGAGRRLCAGIHLAEYELFFVMSRILYCFRIENASPTGEDGKPIPIDLSNYAFELTVWPNDYNVKFVPRGDWIKKLLDE